MECPAPSHEHEWCACGDIFYSNVDVLLIFRCDALVLMRQGQWSLDSDISGHFLPETFGLVRVICAHLPSTKSPEFVSPAKHETV
jgi:hypothetical protein